MRALAICVGFALLAVGCGGSGNSSSDDTPPPQCGDGIDNDGDGTVDFPDDLGCVSATDDTEDSPVLPQCQDGRDNDGDGKSDYPDDPGCFAPQSDSETDDCPSGPNCPQCADGMDNDGNGATDYPGDPGCASASDDDELLASPTACGTTLVVQALPATNVVDGMLDASSTSQIASTCGGGGVPARAYALHIATPKVIEISTDDNATLADTTIDLRSMSCTDASAEIACNGDIDADNTNSKLTAPVQAGTYFIIVSGANSAATGAFHLQVTLHNGEGSACTGPADCGPGLVCRTPHGGTSDVCSKPVCSDGVDDDGDGKIDYPNDPGCATPDDADEADDCPTGPNCPVCGDGVDNDGDGQTDYPNDTTCQSAGDVSESCPTTDGVTAITTATTTGDTSTANDDVTPPSVCSSSSAAPDRTYRLDVPALTSLTVALDPDYDAVLSLFGSTCAGATLDCDDRFSSETVSATDLAAGSYYVVVDGYEDQSGTFSFTVSGKIKGGERCDGALATAGALICEDTYACLDAGGGTKTCQPGPCNNGVDDDGDGKVDYPEDPGCTSIVDPDETDDCPTGPNCPACSDGVDNDGDSQTDYPNDTTCHAASDASESCTSTDGVTLITQGMTAGDTTGQHNDIVPACGSSSSTMAPDQTYRLDVPALTSFDVAIDGFDSVAVLYDSTCGGTPITCSDPQSFHRNSLAAGTYYLIVDGYSSSNLGPYTINISGTIQNGARCDGALATSGALTCSEGYACLDAGGGTKTCQVGPCNNNIDDDGDGKIDYPNDPGCTSISDPDETDDCPSGPNCPACGDGLDNDGDNKVDFPNDTTCHAASDASESCVSSDGVQAITQAVTAGDTTGKHNDVVPACGSTSSTSAPDLTYRLDVPALTSLDLGVTKPSTYWDSVIALFDSTCGGTALECSDPDSLHLDAVAAGTYYFLVDGYSTAFGAFTITVAGTIQNGDRCDGALAQSGALTCGIGYTCLDAGGGTKTCQPSPCADGLDNDGDGIADYPADPGCESPADDTEEDPATLPVCANHTDDDGDGATDWPADYGCTAASSTSEVFCVPETDPTSLITTPTVTGTTVGKTRSLTATCGSSTSTAADAVYALSLPVPVDQLVVDTIGTTSGFDTIVHVKTAACTGTDLGCDDDSGDDAPYNGASHTSRLVLTNVAPGNYAVAVAGYGSSTSPAAFTLNVKGTVAPQTACESPLFAAGVLACPTGTTCSGAAPMRCQ